MNLLNPTITVRNTDANLLLVRWEHTLSEHEHIDVQLKVPKTDLSLPAVQHQLLTQAAALLLELRDRQTPGS